MSRTPAPTDEPPSSTRLPDLEAPGRGDLSPAEAERFAALVKSNRASLEAVARKAIGRAYQGRLDAEGLVSKALSHVHGAIVGRHRQLLADEKQFYSYSVTTLNNDIKDARATEEAQCRDVRRDRTIDAPDSTPQHLAAPSTTSPSRTLSRLEVAHKAKQLVNGLDAMDRHIVLGRGDKKSYADIGREVGLTGDAVRKRHVRILDRFSGTVRAWFGLSSPP